MAAGLFALFGNGSSRERGKRIAPGSFEPAPLGQVAEEEQLLAPEVLQEWRPARAGPSSVLWPLKVELNLIEADFLSSSDGVVAVGSGATAGLVGNISDGNDRGLRAQVRFVAGTNKGRVLLTNANGDFGASDLYPGISIVEVSGAGVVGSRREVVLRQTYEQILNISYYRPATVVGWVKDQMGEPIAGAKVRLDGMPLFTDLDGAFSATNVASGLNVLLEIEHPDYVSKHFAMRLASGRRTIDSQWQFTMYKGSDLQLVVTNDLGGPGPVEVYLLPGGQQGGAAAGQGYRMERFPYHSINPILVHPGRPSLVRGLPTGSVAVYAFRVGAKANMNFVNLRSDRETVHQIRFTSAEQITGTLKSKGKPVEGVELTLEAPNRVRATLAYFSKQISFLENAVMPTLPMAFQTSRTNARGEFRFTEWERESATRYLEARIPEGQGYAGRFVERGERALELELQQAELGDAQLVLDFPGRFQALPVEVHLNGQPLDPEALAAGDELIISDLAAGDWRLKISWHGIEVYPEQKLRIQGDTLRRISLIPECIEGQDEEDWRRAGRDYPLLAE